MGIICINYNKFCIFCNYSEIESENKANIRKKLFEHASTQILKTGII
jgi:hypothetical protein